MNGLNAIRNINRDAAAKQEQTRYQAQYKGDAWYVFDSHSGGWGRIPHDTAKEAQAAADAIEDGYVSVPLHV